MLGYFIVYCQTFLFFVSFPAVADVQTIPRLQMIPIDDKKMKETISWQWSIISVENKEASLVYSTSFDMMSV